MRFSAVEWLEQITNESNFIIFTVYLFCSRCYLAVTNANIITCKHVLHIC